jgi:hypothetical protein
VSNVPGAGKLLHRLLGHTIRKARPITLSIGT